MTSPRSVEARVAGIDHVLRFDVHSKNNSYISEEIAENGIWEPLETEVVRRLVRADDVFIDCGANIGWYTVVAARLGADVVAFEPEPSNLALLHTNVEQNGVGDRVTVHPATIGADSGVTRLRLSNDKQGDHRVVPGLTVDMIEVAMVRLDDHLIDRPPRIIRVDTHGSEVAILRGARQTIATNGLIHATLIVEYWPFGLSECDTSAAELIGLLAPLVGPSHDCFEIDERAGELRQVDLAELSWMSLGGDYSMESGEHTNLAIVPRTQTPLLADLLGDTTPSALDSREGPEAITAQLNRLRAAEYSVYSQNGEDGLLAMLADLTGCPHTIVELGAGGGIECNSRLLRERGWQFAAYDGDRRGCDWVREEFLDAENINSVLGATGLANHIGVLSIDLDSNDFWILHQLNSEFMPVVLVVEYNAILGPIEPLAVPYRRHRLWDHTNFYGASLAAFTIEAHRRGFTLVYCESNGVNAFFVRNDYLDRSGLTAVPVADAYRPGRFGLVDGLGRFTGHLPTNRRFVRVDSPQAADRAYRAASGRGPIGLARRTVHRFSTSDQRRYWRTWLQNYVDRFRGGGPTL